MGSGTVSAGNPERAVGRHRHGMWVGVLVSPGRRATRHARPEVGPGIGAAPPADPLVDSGSVGLRMFNLGTIPASVTPPRSWRRAAWFTIVASAAALLGLLAVGAVLVGPVRPARETVAMPVFPNGVPLAAIGGASGVRPVSDGPVSSASAGVTEIRPAAHVMPVRRRPVVAAPPVLADDPVVATLPPPVVTSVPGEPVIDPTKLLRQTQTFFAEVTSNAQAAADLTDRTVRDDAVALIQRKYGDLSTIQIQSVSLDPHNGVAVCVLRVVAKDGTTTTERTTLRFTLTNDPMITNPGG